MNYKPFSQRDYNENDRVAKLTAIHFLESSGRFKMKVPLDQQPERYKERDFTIEYLNTNTSVSVEAERKNVWKTSGAWQGYPTLDVPVRKKHSKAMIYIMVNDPLDTLAIMQMKTVHTSPTYLKNTKKNGKLLTSQEEFFAVPLNKIQFWTLSSGCWTRIYPI